MASSTSNIKLGVCKVFFDGVDMGYTQGGVEFTSASQTHKVEVDQFGKTTIKETIIGRTCMVKVPLAETTLTNLASLFPVNPNNSIYGAGIVGTSKVRVGIDAGVGVDLLTTAKVLVLHPYALLDSDFSDEIVIPLANTPGALTFAYKLEQERIFNVDYTGYPDPTTGMLFFAGNPFTDAVGKTFAVTGAAAATTLTGTGFGASQAASTVHGKMALLGFSDSAATNSAGGLTIRKGYFVKWVSATTVSLYTDAALTVPAPALSAGGIVGALSLAILS
jgi:hypothetical protein